MYKYAIIIDIMLQILKVTWSKIGKQIEEKAVNNNNKNNNDDEGWEKGIREGNYPEHKEVACENCIDQVFREEFEKEKKW